MDEELTADTIELVKEFEGFEYRAEPCIAGKPTIGYGHTADDGGFPFTSKTRITRETANDILKDDLARVAANLRRFVPVEITGNAFGALVSFAFNLGADALETSTLWRQIRAGCGSESIRKEFTRWCKYTDPETGEKKVAAGLLRRRKAEAALYLGEDFRKFF